MFCAPTRRARGRPPIDMAGVQVIPMGRPATRTPMAAARAMLTARAPSTPMPTVEAASTHTEAARSTRTPTAAAHMALMEKVRCIPIPLGRQPTTRPVPRPMQGIPPITRRSLSRITRHLVVTAARLLPVPWLVRPLGSPLVSLQLTRPERLRTRHPPLRSHMRHCHPAASTGSFLTHTNAQERGSPPPMVRTASTIASFPRRRPAASLIRDHDLQRVWRSSTTVSFPLDVHLSIKMHAGQCACANDNHALIGAAFGAVSDARHCIIPAYCVVPRAGIRWQIRDAQDNGDIDNGDRNTRRYVMQNLHHQSRVMPRYLRRTNIAIIEIHGSDLCERQFLHQASCSVWNRRYERPRASREYAAMYSTPRYANARPTESDE